jgi:hypothetical protein
MAPIHWRNFGLSRRVPAYLRRQTLLQSLDDGIATLLSLLLLICAGLAALFLWLLRNIVTLVVGRLRSRQLLPAPDLLLGAARERVFRYWRRRWCRAQMLREQAMERNQRTSG